MWMQIMGVMDKHRNKKPIDELVRKAKKARRKGILTQEEIDLYIARGRIYAEILKDISDNFEIERL